MNNIISRATLLSWPPCRGAVHTANGHRTWRISHRHFNAMLQLNSWSRQPVPAGDCVQTAYALWELAHSVIITLILTWFLPEYGTTHSHSHSLRLSRCRVFLSLAPLRQLCSTAANCRSRSPAACCCCTSEAGLRWKPLKPVTRGDRRGVNLPDCAQYWSRV